MDLTLVVLAAGIGSRYGGVKQMDPVGPSGEFLIDYGVFDAIRAGFGRIVFVVSTGIEEDFRTIIGKRISPHATVECVIQDMSSLPEGRDRPWGTGHALLAAAPLLNTPFAIVNADDFYGSESYRSVADFLRTTAEQESLHAMIAFVLRNTLSPHGAVCRGICIAGDNGRLRRVEECTNISLQGGNIVCEDRRLNGDEPVSMNIWGFKPSFLPYIGSQFRTFLQQAGNDLRAEFFLPDVVDAMIRDGQGEVEILRSDADWCGMTRREDKNAVARHIESLVRDGQYPETLWTGDKI